MEKLKSIEEIESGITDERFLALFRAFVKALESKDYDICKRLAILRALIGKLEKIHFVYGVNKTYKLVNKVLEEKEYFYWERKILEKK